MADPSVILASWRVFQYPSPALRTSRAASDPAPIASPVWKAGRLPTVFRAEMAAFNGPSLRIAGKDREPGIVRYCEANPSWTPPLRRGDSGSTGEKRRERTARQPTPALSVCPNHPKTATDIPSPNPPRSHFAATRPADRHGTRSHSPALRGTAKPSRTSVVSAGA